MTYDIQEALDKLKVDRRLLSIGGLSQFALFNSSPRGEMLARLLTNSVTLNNGEVRLLLSGLEQEYGKTVFNVKIDNPSRVYTIVPRYDLDTLVEVIVVYQDLVTERFDYRVVPRYMKHHPKFGFNVVWADGLLDLEPDAELPANTILATTSGVSPEGVLKYGVTLQVALTSHVEVAEDAIIASKTACDKLKFTVETTYTKEQRSNEIAMNLHGTIDEPKVALRVGDPVPDDGYIYATRTFNQDNILSQFTKEALMNFDPTFDDGVCVRLPNGVLSDIKVVYNEQAHKSPEIPELEEQLSKLVHQQKIFETQMIRTADDIVKDYGKNTTFDNLYHAEMTRLKMATHPRVRLVNKKSRLGPYTIEMKVKHTIRPNLAYKLTGLNGDKGIISGIEDDDYMPVDNEGNRADLKMFYGSTVGRMNTGRLYEQYITASIVKVRNYIVNNYKKQSIDELFKYLLKYLKIFDNEQYDGFSKMRSSDKLDVIKGIVKTNLYVYLPVDNKKSAFDIVIDLENNDMFRPPKGPVKFIKDGEEIVTRDSILIGPMYMALLNKTGESWLSVASPSLNHFGVPTAPAKTGYSKTTWAANPVRFGNTETRLYSSYAPMEILVKLKERANSLQAQRIIYRNILNAVDPVNIEEVITRDELEYGTDIITSIIDNVYNTFGMGTKYVKENK